MLQKVLEDDDVLQVSSAWRLVNIAGTVRDRKGVKVSKRLCYQASFNGRVYSITNPALVVEMGT
jgi:hypothetical protein